MNTHMHIDNQLHNSDELYHYGVLGMKWGIRRYQNKDGSLTPAGKAHYNKTGEYGYHYKSFGTGHNERKAAKMQTKIDKAKSDGNIRKAEKYQLKKDKYEYRAERSRELDRREQEYSKNVSTVGNIIARSLSMVGTKPYLQWTAMLNNSDRSSVSKKMVAHLLAAYGGRAWSTTAKAIYIRNGEPKAK